MMPSVPALRLSTWPGTNATITPQFLPQCVCTASFSLMSSSLVLSPFLHTFIRPVDVGFKTSFHLFQHCFFVRPGTSAAIASQFLPPFIFTVFFNLSSSTVVQRPVRADVRSLLECKVWSRTSTATAVQSVLYSLPHFCLLLFVTALISFASSSGSSAALAFGCTHSSRDLNQHDQHQHLLV
jgi:hypothetical protein